MSKIEDQPKPKATDRRPMWPEVIAYVERNYEDDNGDDTLVKVIVDMRDRDDVGRKRYGVPLTSHNGRDSLIDAYQEMQDFTVYVRTWLDERGIDVLTPEVVTPTNEREKLGKKPKPADAQEETMIEMFVTAVEMLVRLRGMIK